jgi:large repetitive protein
MKDQRIRDVTIISCVLMLVCLSLLSSSVSAQSAARITWPIDDSAVTRIPYTTHPYATASNDLGRAIQSLPLERMILVLTPSEAEEAAARKFLNSQHDKQSATYHQWLSPEEYGRLFGAHDADLSQLSAWLQDHGFTINSVARGRQWIAFSGDAGQVERAFHTEIHHYLVKGEDHIANSTDISLPQALVPLVGGVLSLHNFQKKADRTREIRVHRDHETGKLVPDFTLTNGNGTFHFLTPGDYAKIYNTEPLLQSHITGSGVSIAIVGRTNINLSDVQMYRQMFLLPANDPRFIINGQDPGVNGDEIESALDVEWSGAVAPDATINLVISGSTFTTDGVDLSAAYIVDNRIAPIMSSSYGECEAFLGTAGNAFFNNLYQQAAAEGISVFVSSGDSGSAGCDFPGQSGGPAIYGANVSGTASTPFSTAVGGTQFNEKGLDGNYWLANNRPDQSSATGYIPEAVWNESCDPTVDPNQCFGTGSYFLSAGGGGPSNCSTSTLSNFQITCISGTPKPSWQAGIGVPNDGVRDLPDLSLAAAANHDGYLMCVEGSCQTVESGGHTVIENAFVVGGTSAGAPSMAGIMALLEQESGAFQGLANYTFYQLAASENLAECNSSALTDPNKANSCVFYDVTVGNNGVPGQVGYDADKGYDMSTGLGSVNAANLVAAWKSARKLRSTAALAVGAKTTKHGQPVPLALAVAPAAGHGAPSGDFSLLTEGHGSAFGGTLTNGTFSGTVSDLPGGTYNLLARYGGDAMFASSDSNQLAIRVVPEESALSPVVYSMLIDGVPVPISALGNAIFYGFPLAFEIDVKGKSGIGSPTGRATITLDDSTVVGTIPLAQGATGFTYYPQLNPLPGPHHLTISYNGDDSFQPAIQAVHFAVKKGIPEYFIDTVPSTVTEGTPVKVFMTLIPALPLSSNTPVPPTGTIDLWDNSKHLAGPFQLADHGLFGNVSQASYSAHLPAGSHALSLTYSGDANYASSFFLKRSFYVTVNSAMGAGTKVTFEQNPGTIMVGQSVSYVMTVRPAKDGAPMPTGTVTLISIDGLIQSPPIPLVNGNATFTQPYYASGLFLDDVSYSGDSNYSPANSPSLLTNVTQLVPTVRLTAAARIVHRSKPTSVTVSVIGEPKNPNLAIPAGLVRFYDAVDGGPEHSLGSAQYLTIGNGGNAIYTLPLNLPTGTHVIRAQYLGSKTSPLIGDPNDWSPASSNLVSVSVREDDSL